jgi:hypothetical protein
VSSGRGCHGRRGRKPATSRACQAPSDPKSQGKQAGGLALHRRRRIDGGGGDPRRRRREKEKGEGEGGPAREAGWAAWAEKEPVLISLFFPFFSNFIFKSFFISNSIQTFQIFLKNFINFLETTQATKNHASQLMMHKHLLSLGLLNYI